MAEKDQVLFIDTSSQVPQPANLTIDKQETPSEASAFNEETGEINWVIVYL
jgi:hypothetical protein